MRKFMLTSLLLLSILAHHQAHGTRLIKTSISAKQHSSNIREEMRNLRTSNGGTEEMGATANEDENHGFETGSNRKLMPKTPTTSSTTTISKNDKNDHEENKKAGPTGNKGQSSNETSPSGKEENFSVNSSSTSAKRPPETTAPDDYPDVLDITGMDYSPARRKPPIHN